MQKGTDGKKIYFDVLIWAYEHDGDFTQKELNEAFNLKGVDHQWVQKIFFQAPPGTSPLIKHKSTYKEEGYFQLTEKGISAAISYLDLKEARMNAERSNKHAIWSIVIAVTALLFSLFFNYQMSVMQNEALNLTRKSLDAAIGPQFSFAYSERNFFVESADNIQILDVGWYIPSIIEDEEVFEKIEVSGTVLSLGKLQQSLLLKTLGDYEFNTENIAHYFRCYHLNGYGDGIPLLVNINYMSRGNGGTSEISYLVYAKGTGRGDYFVDIETIDADDQEKKDFAKSALITYRVISEKSLSENYNYDSYQKFCESTVIFGPNGYRALDFESESG